MYIGRYVLINYKLKYTHKHTNMHTCTHTVVHIVMLCNYKYIVHIHMCMYICMYNSLILSIETLLTGPDPNTFIAVTVTLTSLSTAGRSIVAIGTSTLTELSVIFSPE